MLLMLPLLILLSHLLLAVRADYWLQRSWPLSSTCDSTSPSFSYVDTGASLLGGVPFGACHVNDGQNIATKYSCYNATTLQVNVWNTSYLNCNGPQPPGYPYTVAISGATGSCIPQPGGIASALGACVISSPLVYVPPASEPLINSIYSSTSNCSGTPYFISSASASLPACAAIVYFGGLSFGGGNAYPPPLTWGSIAISTTCGAGGNLTYSAYNSSTTCAGAPATTGVHISSGVCTTNGGSNLLVQGISPCPAAGGSAAAADLSTGAIIGIAIGGAAVFGLAATAFIFVGKRKSNRPVFSSSGDVTVMKPRA